MIDIKREFVATEDQALNYLQEVVEKISTRFTKTYYPPSESNSETQYIIPVEFYEPKNKTPVAIQKAKLIFYVPKSLDNSELSFQIENESVFYPIYQSVNLNYFETILDRVVMNKDRMSTKLLVHTNFESTRILTLNGDNLKLYTVEEKENIFSNNNGNYFNYNKENLVFKVLNMTQIDKHIQTLWKTLVSGVINSNTDCLDFENFKLLFEYGKLNFSEANLQKLWKYCDKDKKNFIKYSDFVYFCLDLIQCLRAYHIAYYKHENNNFIKNKIKHSVDIMNLHFKEYDFENNQEISFENLKKCLLKENDLFSRKDIEIILKQINPEKNFEYWKFDSILNILYMDHFDYIQLMKEDKIYNYLIEIFSKQDTLCARKLHYKKMKYALLIEEKLKLNKVQIMVILNFFNINKNPEIDYFKASLIIRDIVQELFSADMSMQKVDITQSQFQNYNIMNDVYDDYMKNLKGIFLNFDKDFDHVLKEEEFKEFLSWLLPFITDTEHKEIFNFSDSNKDGKISFPEFKSHFESIMRMTRIKIVIKNISEII